MKRFDNRLPTDVTTVTETSHPRFRQPDVPLAERVEDLLSRLTLAEKIALLHQHQPAVDRLGIAAFRTGTEALHGLAWLGPATVFPQAVGLATTWNPDLVRRVGAAAGDEVRGLHHKDPARCGLNVWAPVVNPLRDPRWGRNEEGYAEDPLLTGVIGHAYAARAARRPPAVPEDRADAQALPRLQQRDRPRHHLEQPEPAGAARVRAARLPARRSQRGAAVAVMASYNLVNGRPAHSRPLINDELRSWTDDEILVVSDAYAPSNLADRQQAYYADHAASHAAALKAGVDSFTDDDDRADGPSSASTEALAPRPDHRGGRRPGGPAGADHPVPAGRVRPGRANPYAEITEDVDQLPGAPGARPGGGPAVDRAAQDGVLPAAR